MIPDWIAWFAIAGMLVAIEIFTGTFYLLMIAIGMVAGGLVALGNLHLSLQLIVAAIVAAICTLLLRRSRYGTQDRKPAANDPNVNLDIGRIVHVDAWTALPGGPKQARVSYRGAMWDVELKSNAEASAGRFIIREVRANRLIVDNAPEQAA